MSFPLVYRTDLQLHFGPSVPSHDSAIRPHAPPPQLAVLLVDHNVHAVRSRRLSVDCAAQPSSNGVAAVDEVLVGLERAGGWDGHCGWFLEHRERVRFHVVFNVAAAGNVGRREPRMGPRHGGTVCWRTDLHCLDSKSATKVGAQDEMETAKACRAIIRCAEGRALGRAVLRGGGFLCLNVNCRWRHKTIGPVCHDDG